MGNGFEALAEPVPELCKLSTLDVDLERLEQHVFSTVHQSRRHLLVQRLPLVEETAELRLVLRERATASAHALPCVIHFDVHPERERVGQQKLACAL